MILQANPNRDKSHMNECQEKSPAANFSLYGLLYLKENQSSSIMDLYAETYVKKRRFYIKSAVNLSRSLRKRGVSFTLLTNNEREILDELDGLGYRDSLEVKSIDFQLKVPDGLFYYSTHFKLDVFRYFASLSSDRYVGLIDIDAIAVNDFPICLKNLIEAKIPACYDVSDQLIPAFGHDVILRDMQRLSPDICAGRWYGGELIMGTPDFFAELNEEAQIIYKRYIAIVDELFHKGDEAIVSVALERIQRNGIYIADLGTLGVIGRFFSAPKIKHPQKSFRYFENCFLLHLPVDKSFLAKLNPEQAESREIFLKHYQSYLSTIWIVKGIQKLNRIYCYFLPNKNN
jgi:hypothetical protein